MKLNFEKAKIGTRGQLGGLFFDEVKIKEGLVFNPSTFELVGFTDLDDDETELPSIGQLKESDSQPKINWQHMFCSFTSRASSQSLTFSVHFSSPEG